ncbi:TonB family protein [Leptothermofonsia sp. ETS-13]|uniref:energy transducer TonB n=1 Tax=Leptothermofonsia sp. ETS-13 TaxID=3035696 RepID=UPI003BA186F4
MVDSHLADRRRSESPAFWVLLVAGSVLFHILLFLSLRQFLSRLIKVEVEPAPISVEFVEPSTIASQLKSTTSKREAPRLTSEQSKATVPSQTTNSQVAIAPQTVFQPAPDPTQSPSPPFPSQNRPTQPPRNSTPRQESNRKPSPPPRNPAGETNNPEFSRSPAQPILPVPPEVSSGGSSITGDPGASGSTGAGNPSLPEVTISSDRGQGRGLKVTILRFTNANTGRDVTDRDYEVARPLSTSQSFPDIAYQPSVELNLGSSITLKVLVDRDGNLQRVDVIEGSRAADYDELAKRVIQKLQFEPARQAGQPVDSLAEIELRIDRL